MAESKVTFYDLVQQYRKRFNDSPPVFGMLPEEAFKAVRKALAEGRPIPEEPYEEGIKY